MSLIICIRYAGEASLERCKEFISRQVGSDTVIEIIQERPFWKSMEKCFQSAKAANKRWLMCVDADVYLRSGAIDYLLSEAERMPRDHCELQGQMYDRFFGGVRAGGIHLYRGDHLDALLEGLQETRYCSRPERDLLLLMAKRGKPHRKVDYIVGLHDFDQYYIDVYRKGFQHGKKHLAQAKFLVPYWKSELENNPDYGILLSGFGDGIKNSEELNLDRTEFIKRYSGIVDFDISEVFFSNVAEYSDIEGVINYHEEPVGFNEFFLGSAKGVSRSVLKIEHYARIFLRKIVLAFGFKRN